MSNSGRLRALLLDKAAGRSVQVQVELHPSVDGVLSRMENVVTADAIILDKCGSWYNSHNSKNNTYRGYWCFEIAALSKIFGIDDKDFALNPYYPYDLAHY